NNVIIKYMVHLVFHHSFLARHIGRHDLFVYYCFTATSTSFATPAGAGKNKSGRQHWREHICRQTYTHAYTHPRKRFKELAGQQRMIQ
ncbi:MAG TPA: hypothetical protein VJP79_12260, partial [Nitrososphaera sp.]|nr:hypothetical protein [Nitrososphaera sp.]